jgi:hypothetical protein
MEAGIAEVTSIARLEAIVRASTTPPSLAVRREPPEQATDPARRRIVRPTRIPRWKPRPSSDGCSRRGSSGGWRQASLQTQRAGSVIRAKQPQAAGQATQSLPRLCQGSGHRSKQKRIRRDRPGRRGYSRQRPRSDQFGPRTDAGPRGATRSSRCGTHRACRTPRRAHHS